MSDLIERLRDMAAFKHDDLSIGNDAADELERLQRELYAEKYLITQLKRENEELRDALESADGAITTLEKYNSELIELRDRGNEELRKAAKGGLSDWEWEELNHANAALKAQSTEQSA